MSLQITRDTGPGLTNNLFTNFVNGTFDTATLTGITVDTGGTLASDSSFKRTGSRSVRFTLGTLSFTETYALIPINDLKKNKRYSVSCYVAYDSAISTMDSPYVYLGIDSPDYASTVISNDLLYFDTIGTSTWTKINMVFETGDDVSNFYIKIYLGTGDLGTMTFNVDDMVVKMESHFVALHNQNYYSFTSDLSSVDYHKFIVKLIDSVTSNVVLSTQTNAGPDGVAIFDPGRYLKSTILTPLPHKYIAPKAITSGVSRHKITVQDYTLGKQSLVTSISNQATQLQLNMRTADDDYSGLTFNVGNDIIDEIVLPGLILSHSGPYSIKTGDITTAIQGGLVYNQVTNFKLSKFTAPSTYTNVTATGTFAGPGYVSPASNAENGSAIIYHTGAIQTSSESIGIKAAFDVEDYLDVKGFGAFIPTSFTKGKALTYYPDNTINSAKLIGSNDAETLHFIQAPNNNYYQMYIEYFNSSKNSINDQTIILSLGGSFTYSAGVYSGTDYAIIAIPTGPNNITDFNIGTAFTAKYYSIELQDSSGNRMTNKYFYEIDESCDTVRLMWRNTLGGWDYTVMNYEVSSETTTEQKTYKKFLPIDYKKGERGDTVYHKQASTTITVNTKLISQAEADWLEEMVLSAEIYAIDNRGDAKPYIHLSKNYKPMKKKDRIRQYVIQLQTANNRPINA